MHAEPSHPTTAFSTARTDTSAGDALTTLTPTATARETERETELQASGRSAATCRSNCRSLGALIAQRSRATGADRPSRLNELNAALERDLADLARSVHVPSSLTPTTPKTPTANSSASGASSTAASSQRSLPVAQLACALTSDNVDVLRTICTAAARLKRSSDALLARPEHSDAADEDSELDLVTAVSNCQIDN